MTEQLDPSRRNLLKFLSTTPLMPLAGGSVTAALLSACGGGNSESQGTQLKSVTFSGMAAPSVAFTYPGLEPEFNAAIAGLNLVEDMKFGTAATPSGSPVGIAIKTLPEVAALFNPLEGVFNANGGHLRGTGPSTINAEVQRYATTFNADNHVFEADGLRLQAVLNGGHFDSYLRGNINTSASSNGLNAGTEGASTPTRLIDIGLTVADLDKIEIGTCIVGGTGSGGLSVVVAKDAIAGTITFEVVNSNVRTAYKGNWHVTFTKFAFSRVAENVVNGTTTTILFKTPVASSVVPGMFAMGVDYALSISGRVNAGDRARVLSVSANRLSVTFDRPVKLSCNVSNTGDGILFVPGLTSGQLWSKRPYGPQQPDHQVQAIEVELTMPAMPQYAGNGGIYSKTSIETAMAGAPGTAWGYWPAVWLFPFAPTEPYSELDIFELFTSISRGQSTWTGFLHKQPYTRQVALQPGTNIARNGGTWKSSIATTVELTPNTSNLLMPTPIASGTKRTVGIIWTRDKVLHYMDGIPVAESNWPVNILDPHQLGINMACGSLSPNNASALLFPQQDSQATSQFLKIHSIKTWEL